MKTIPLQLPADVVLSIYHLKQQNNDTDLLELSHVCRIWRDALWKFPDFWAKVDIHLGKRNPDEKAAYWIKCAGQKPLSIHIRSHFPHLALPAASLCLPSSILVRLSLVLCGCIDRWESFTIESTFKEVERLLPLCAGCVPRLRHFSLDCRWTRDDVRRLLVPFLPPVEPPSDSFQLSISVYSCIPRFTMFGTGITYLSVNFSVDIDSDPNSFHMNDLLGLFHSCPNLIEFDFSALGAERGDGPTSREIIILRRLTSLRISWIWNIADVLDFLQLPSLELLILYEVDWSHASKVALWSVFRSSHLLSTVMIGQDGDDYYFERDPGPFTETPLILHSVTTLHTQGRLLPPLLDLLTLPNLTELNLSGAPFVTVHRIISSSTKLCDLSLHYLEKVPESDTDPFPILIPVSIPVPALAPILLPSLLSLEISGMPAFIDSIHAPHLHTLKLESRPYGDSARTVGSEDFLCAAIERSAAALRTLHLSGLDAGDKDVQWCLERLSELKELSVSSCAISDSTLAALASPSPPPSMRDRTNQDGNTGWLLPHLEKFVFDRNDGITPTGAIEFLAARTGNVSPVPKIGVGLSGEFGFENIRLSQEDATSILSYGRFLSAHHTFAFSDDGDDV
ncbi:hypothetical protein BOTBODRAFT_181533 [Botryobasidium botryosum FD-172 SS1]|uniref:Uncharacterized protein n=1 Tax=Botryobasidium botryosum (strain FD-172 SS1) TaxID=930990 RepID=A0A067LTT9_BOTB1|nr:hypothetical protein BOTBODRAFT_181533 [Botryobasidium botryosum FD-172 SS1]